MSIQEFHSQLTQTDQADALIATLSRLTVVDDPWTLGQVDGWDDWGGGTPPGQ